MWVLAIRAFIIEHATVEHIEQFLCGHEQLLIPLIHFSPDLIHILAALRCRAAQFRNRLLVELTDRSHLLLQALHH
jgi:hypothetical protein